MPSIVRLLQRQTMAIASFTLPDPRPGEDLGGRVAVVTGAASGIGRALAQELAEHGCLLALGDMDMAGLQQTARMLPSDLDVVLSKVDVSDREAVHSWAQEVADHFGRIDLVVNNAGIAHSSTVQGMDYADFDRVMAVNLMGVVHGTKAFLPHLLESDRAHLVNVSSLFGVIGVPTQSAYCSAKFAVRGFTESLSEEMIATGSPVRVHVVMPGGVDTEIAARSTFGDVVGFIDPDRAAATFSKMAATSPREAAESIVDGVRHGRRRIPVGADARVIDRMVRLIPEGYQHVVARSLSTG